MVQYQLKLKLNRKQEQILCQWLWNLTGVYNWAIRKIELDGRDGRYYSKRKFQGLLAGHSIKLGIPAVVLEGMLLLAYNSWRQCFNGLVRRPKLKGQRNKLSVIPFHFRFAQPIDFEIGVPLLGRVRFHKQSIPMGSIHCGQIIRRANGWYLCLWIDAPTKPIAIVSNNLIGIDPGFKSLLTLSNGEKIAHPRELEMAANRLAQAQRGRKKKLTARLQERIGNQRKDRNHKLSRRLVAENKLIAFSADNHGGIARRFGKSVSSSGHGQLRRMLSYKSRSGGREYIEVESRYTTMRCSACGEINQDLRGLSNLAVREWDCACGAHHDRDVNAAVNVLHLGLGISHEVARKKASPKSPILEKFNLHRSGV